MLNGSRKGFIGDIDLFLQDGMVEFNVMIAESSQRRKGYATEAIQLIMNQGTFIIVLKKGPKLWPIRGFMVKIGMNNLSSLNLFREKLGFQMAEKSDIFNEWTLVYHLG